MAMLSAAPPAFAQGYFSGIQGARAAGRAGAFTARADDLSAVEVNPAGIATLGTTVIHIGNRISYNDYAYTRQPTLDWGHPDSNGRPPLVHFDRVHNQQPWQALDPMLAIGTNFGLRDWGFAVAAYAPAGIAREQYPSDGGQRYMMLSRDAQIINYTGSAAWKYHDKFGIGVSLQWIAVPSLKYQLVINGNPLSRSGDPVSSGTDMRATVSGSDPFTLNAIVGAWYRPAKYLQWGLSAQVIPSDIRVRGTLSVDPESAGITERVQLTRNQQPADDVTLVLPLPIKLREGVRYRHLNAGREIFDIELDIAYEFWSRVQRFTMNGDGLTASLLGQEVPVGRIDIQKHWKTTIGIELGGDYALVPQALTVRGGAFYVSKVADPGYSHIDFVGGRQVGAALGTSVFIRGFQLALAYEYRHQMPVTVSEQDARVYQEVPGSPCQAPYTNARTCNSHYLGLPAPPVNAGTYRADSQTASIDMLYRF